MVEESKHKKGMTSLVRFYCCNYGTDERTCEGRKSHRFGIRRLGWSEEW
jgi:hypothetical protein